MSDLSRNAGSAERHDDIVYPDAIPFVLLHLGCFAAFWTGVPARMLVLALLLYVARMFGVTAGFHRYFSHRAFKTSRFFQLLLAILAQSSAQRGVLWWAAQHRSHHRHSDTELDVHSPHHSSVFFAHVGWVYGRRSRKADYSNVKDLARFPELVWLDRHHHLPVVALAAGCLLWGGWAGLVVGFVWSTVALYHGTFAINSVAHLWGRQRYFTGDESRNNPLLAVLTLGEGWHNNHHYFMASARQGFRWWEFDPTYWVLRVLAWFRIVWDVREPTPAVVRGEKRLPTAHIERAGELVADRLRDRGLPPEALDLAVREAAAAIVGRGPSLPQVVERALAHLR